MSPPAAEQLALEWRDAGIREGDTVLVHSSLRRTLRRVAAGGTPPDVELVLDSLLQATGEGGTLLLPLFNFDFTRGETFDIRSTPSRMGALTEAARHRPGAIRTGHPIYSFAALGGGKDRFRGVCNESAYGPDSPFGLLRAWGGKIAVLDLPDQESMTFYHHVEEACGAPYRYSKMFTGGYIDAAGHRSERSFSVFVRDLDRGVRTHVDPMGELLWSEGLYSGERPGVGCGMRVIEARAMFDLTAAALRDGRAEGLLYRIETS